LMRIDPASVCRGRRRSTIRRKQIALRCDRQLSEGIFRAGWRQNDSVASVRMASARLMVATIHWPHRIGQHMA
jgi:hypothetical protein